jgi:hypothetical protein
VIGLVVVAVLAAAALGGVIVAAGGSAVAAGLAGGAVAVASAAMAMAALQPRLERRNAALVVRLRPLAAERVPLAVVECVFPGSQPLPRVGGPETVPADRRVGTIVIRLAERATEWRHRRTFVPWGTWNDGHIVLDGRWCEPLSSEFTRGLGGRLVEAKRQANVLGPDAPPAGPCADTTAGCAP